MLSSLTEESSAIVYAHYDVFATYYSYGLVLSSGKKLMVLGGFTPHMRHTVGLLGKCGCGRRFPLHRASGPFACVCCGADQSFAEDATAVITAASRSGLSRVPEAVFAGGLTKIFEAAGYGPLESYLHQQELVEQLQVISDDFKLDP